MENESFERALEPQPNKRKRSSILKPPEKRVSRDLRTVSFSDRCIYKELHPDGTCDITNLFLSQDMDLTYMEVVETVVERQEQTFGSNMDISVTSVDETDQRQQQQQQQDQMNGSIQMQPELPNESVLMQQSQTHLSIHKQQHQTFMANRTQTDHPDESVQMQQDSINESVQIQQTQPDDSIQMQPQQTNVGSQIQLDQTNESSQMDISIVSQFVSTMPKVNTIDLPSVNYEVSTIYDKNLSTESSKISSFDTNQSFDDTIFGAFHESNNISLHSRASGIDTLIHNIEALNDCIQKVDREVEESRRRLDMEMENLFSFYPHIVNKQDNYEFAIKIFGLRYGLWLIIKINPDMYPNEKLDLKFAVKKRDRHLYPFPEFAAGVKRSTKEGSYGYLTRFVINAQKFRRFLRRINYEKSQD